MQLQRVAWVTSDTIIVLQISASFHAASETVIDVKEKGIRLYEIIACSNNPTHLVGGNEAWKKTKQNKTNQAPMGFEPITSAVQGHRVKSHVGLSICFSGLISTYKISRVITAMNAFLHFMNSQYTYMIFMYSKFRNKVIKRFCFIGKMSVKL